MGLAIIDQNSITCIRGPLGKMELIVKDRQENEYFCKIKKNLFEMLPDARPIEVFNTKGSLVKKFLKSYLTIVKELKDD